MDEQTLRELEQLVLNAVADWYENEPYRARSTVGIPATGLQVIERFRVKYPLERADYLTPGRGQVSRLGGRSGDRIVARFVDDAPSLGTEAGRTSRGTPDAARRLAERLNALESELGSLSEEERGHLAGVMQRWIVDNPLTDYFQRQKLAPSIDAGNTSVSNITAILLAGRNRNQAGPVAQHLVGAKLAIRFPNQDVSNYSYSTADEQTGRHGDFQLGDTVFHVTMAPSDGHLQRCKDNVEQGFRAVLLVPEDSREAAFQMARNHGLAERVAVLSIESFVGQNLEELGEFHTAGFASGLRRLLETYNQRVEEVEPDKSLLIEIPANL